MPSLPVDLWRMGRPGKAAQHWWQDWLLLLALGVAVGLHGLLLLIDFVGGQDQAATTRDVAVAVHLQPSRPIKSADYLAQQDQQGGGELKQSQARTTPIPQQSTDNSIGEQAQRTLQQLAQKPQLTFEERMLMTTLSWQKQQENEQRKQARQQLDSQRQARAAMIASIEAQFAQRQQLYTRQQRIHTVADVQAKRDASAAYLERFRQKVEMFGNREYPELARQQGLSGDVRLMVILNAQGGIRAIRLLDSSGHAVLDDAAKASVRRAAPFGPFDAGMKDISELRIIRTWRFEARDSVFAVQ